MSRQINDCQGDPLMAGRKFYGDLNSLARSREARSPQFCDVGMCERLRVLYMNSFINNE
jgi:hypothetical protein